MKTPLLADLFKARAAIALLAVGQLLLALFAVAPAIAGLASGLGQRPALAGIAAGSWPAVALDLAAELAAADARPPVPADPALRNVGVGLALAFLTGALAVVGHALLYVFVSGAALASLADPEAGVWRAGRRWFFPMLRLSLILLPAVTLLVLLGALALDLFPGNAVAVVGLWLVAMAALDRLFELSRARMIRGASRSALSSLWAAAGSLARRPVLVAGTWLLLTLGNLAVYALVMGLTAAIPATLPAAAWFATLVAILLGAGYKVFRLAAQYHLALFVD